MKIIYHDGSYLTCTSIKFEAEYIVADEYRFVNYMEVARIIDEKED